MNRRKASTADVFSNPILVGSIILALALIGIVLSYGANHGLPFVPAYEVKVLVPDAAELIQGGSEVRVGGARVGLVTKVEAEPGRGGKPAYAQLTLALQKSQEPIAIDSHVKVRPRSILGAKYLDLQPGTSSQGLAPGAVLPLSQALPIVELDEAFNVFDNATSRGLQNTITSLGDAVAGRGQAMNDGTAAATHLLPPLQRILQTAIDPRVQLGRLIRGTAATFQGLAPVAPTLVGLLDNGITTLQALNASAPALGSTIDELPRTEAQGSRSLARIRPVLADLSTIVRTIRPGTALLPQATVRLRDALRAGTPILARTPALADNLGTALAALGTLARDPNSAGSVKKLTTTVQSLKPTLDAVLPAQLTCNVLPVAFRNAYGAVSVGDQAGSWFNFTLIAGSTQDSQSKFPSANLHVTPTPAESASACEAGNEPYAKGQRIGHPGGPIRNSTVMTSPPPGVAALGAQAGLVGTP